MRKSEQKFYLKAGPGGVNCPCCFPAPGKRKGIFRSAKRKTKIAAMRVEAAELTALDANE